MESADFREVCKRLDAETSRRCDEAAYEFAQAAWAIVNSTADLTTYPPNCS